MLFAYINWRPTCVYCTICSWNFLGEVNQNLASCSHFSLRSIHLLVFWVLTRNVCWDHDFACIHISDVRYYQDILVVLTSAMYPYFLQVGDPIILQFNNGAKGFLVLPRPLLGGECDDRSAAGTCTYMQEKKKSWRLTFIEEGRVHI